MDYLENLELIKRLGNEIVKPRSYCYSEEMVGEYLRQYKDIDYEPMVVSNSTGESLKASLFTRGEPSDICIVFMHGLGSTRLEGLNLLKQLPEGYSLCVFDFSGSGKSEGTCVTYGSKEKHDIGISHSYLEAILKVLRLRYSKFVLWGRSMGAVSALLHTISYHNPSDVIMLVLDSPFSSFEQITKQLALRKVSVPSFMISILLDLVKSNFKRLSHDPFEIDVRDCSSCRVPALFVYSEQDDVVSSEHSQRIINSYKGKYDRFVIVENHNAPRTRDTLRRIFNSIEQNRVNSESVNSLPSETVHGVRRRGRLFESTDKDFNRKNRGINVVSMEKSIKKEPLRKTSMNKQEHLHRQGPPVKQPTSSMQAIDLDDGQYYVRSTDLKCGSNQRISYERKHKQTTSSPKRSIPGAFYYSFEDELAYSLTEKISQKMMMLSNQRYL